MAMIGIDGYKGYWNSNGTKSIIINSDHIDECMMVYRKNSLDGVAVTVAHDYKLQNVDFLSEYQDIKHLSVSEGIKDISAIHNLKNLESLTISGKNRKIDFSHFPHLKELVADWSPNFLNIDKCTQLKNLSLYNYSPGNKDCSSISNTPWIEKLLITQSTITTLRGLEKFDKLKEIEFNYCSRLATLCCLEASKDTLVSLLFSHCKSIKNHDYVVLFYNLKILSFNDGGTISSIKFIKEMPSIESFRFVRTEVTDGDMSAGIGLRYAAFTNKKQFTHTMEQIKHLSKT